MHQTVHQTCTCACLLFRAGKAVEAVLRSWEMELPMERRGEIGSLIDQVTVGYERAKTLVRTANDFLYSNTWPEKHATDLWGVLREISDECLEPWQQNALSPPNPTILTPTQLQVDLALGWKKSDPLKPARAMLSTWFFHLRQSWLDNMSSSYFSGPEQPLPLPGEPLKFFMASSSEGLDVARAIRSKIQSLQPTWDIRLWSDPHSFTPSDSTLNGLHRIMTETHLGIYVLTPDDKLQMRQKNLNAARGNVIFELGLGMGLHGIKRSFIVQEGSVDVISDLKGITPLGYEAPPAQDSWLRRFLQPWRRSKASATIPEDAVCQSLAEKIIHAAKDQQNISSKEWSS